MVINSHIDPAFTLEKHDKMPIHIAQAANFWRFS